MAKSPVIQMQNWFLNNQHQWWCGPPMMSYGHDETAWFEYTEALQDATGFFCFSDLNIIFNRENHTPK